MGSCGFSFRDTPGEKIYYLRSATDRDRTAVLTLAGPAIEPVHPTDDTFTYGNHVENRS